MSGIAGAFRLRTLARRDSVDLVRRMLAVMAHRGPDQTALYRSGNDSLVFGACRPAPLQKDAATFCVAATESGSVHGVLDGEIYNSVALRHGLTFAGHALRGGGDDEIVVHSFEQHGVDCLSRFNGRFALALWDDRLDRLLLARDRLGKKPLYFLVHEGLLLFASEIKALTAAVPFRRCVDPLALQQYLSWGFVAPPLTMFQGVGKLAAGEFMVAEPGGEIRRRAWWRPGFDASRAARLRSLPADRHRANLRGLLENSVADRVSDARPLACLVCDGAVDLTVARHAARLLGRPLDAVWLHPEGAGGPGLDGEGLRLLPTAIGPRDVADALPDLVRHLDEPICELATPFLWRGAQSLNALGASAALTGDGTGALLAPGAIPQPARGLIARLIARWRSVPNAGGDLGPFADDEPYRLIGPAIAPATRQAATRALRDSLPPVPSWLPAGEAAGAVLALRGILPEARLMSGDKMAMAHGLELRSPFLDHPLVDYALALRGVSAGPGLLAELVGVTPSGGSDPLAAAMGRWLAGGLGDCYAAAVRRSRLFDDGLLDRAGCLELLRRHRRDGRQAARLWAVLMLAEWYDLFWLTPRESGAGPALPWPDHTAAAE